MALQRKSKAVIQQGIDDLTPFNVGNVVGVWFDRWADAPTGQLPAPYAECMRGELGDSKVFVVFSYDTPIAWRPFGASSGWEVPDHKYSRTTTNHQGIVMVAIDNHGFWTQSQFT